MLLVDSLALIVQTYLAFVVGISLKMPVFTPLKLPNRKGVIVIHSWTKRFTSWIVSVDMLGSGVLRGSVVQSLTHNPGVLGSSRTGSFSTGEAQESYQLCE